VVNCFDDETMVPMLVRVPNNKQNGSRSPALVELVDVYPTLIDLCQLPSPPQPLEGLSFRPLLENPARPWKKAAFHHRAYAVNILGVKTKQFNLIDFAGDSVQLFDRINDPFNLRNIADTHPEVVQEMKAIQQQGWQGALPD
jgi:arylsulfatase A-like enzyme